MSGATLIDQVRARLSPEGVARLCAVVFGSMIVGVGLSRSTPLSCLALGVGGASWTLLNSTFNVGVQLSAPRWVTARALAWFNMSITAGLAFGAWGWGQLASAHGVGAALVVSGTAMMLSALVGLLLPVPKVVSAELQAGERTHQPDVAMALTPRSGPVVIEIDYRVSLEDARGFYNAMQKVRSARLRSGGFEWSLARDIGEPELWTERYHCPTWRDYLRQRDRLTQSDLEHQREALDFSKGRPSAVRRRLERPFGSVRWRAESPEFLSEVVRLSPQ